ncbi:MULTISPECIES: hypothetical protein [Actinotignum]|uniref:hypothetical protein n=1 Tax=Actinotignum TaxID=1653174 RepID=UPI00254C77FD|nr:MULTISPECIES: hypothetical protein [Actinotignum]MDK7272069.1 hypothetical protein [Actinotignum schaalii]MDK8287410.1 hypothetical protein [Actinotignum sanguinis]MDK8651420.1 hypothetical protein [Actinotignum sanguinis]MDK8801963.1 hypothetical protein [Actinotignum sanguinis]MDY5144857.1 hypothetical protein [Actinotignum timonense]
MDENMDTNATTGSAGCASKEVEALRAAEQERFTKRLEAGVHLQEIAARLRALEGEYRGAWTVALKAGWSERELKNYGLTAPTQARKKPRTKRTPSPSVDAHNVEQTSNEQDGAM